MMKTPRPPLAYIIRRAAQLADTGEFGDRLEIEGALIREDLPEAVEALAQRPGLCEYLDQACIRSRNEKSNPPKA
jgi:hypothetical protein